MNTLRLVHVADEAPHDDYPSETELAELRKRGANELREERRALRGALGSVPLGSEASALLARRSRLVRAELARRARRPCPGDPPLAA